jgi:hypothetical protein
MFQLVLAFVPLSMVTGKSFLPLAAAFISANHLFNLSISFCHQHFLFQMESL